MNTRIDWRNLWVQVHLWLGLSLGLIGALVGLTGSVLVFDREIDHLLNPQRYAITGDTLALPYGDYVTRAAQAAGERARPANLRLPEAAGEPLTVLARGRGEGAGFVRVYLDPQSGQVLQAAEGGGLIGWAHNFHESLTLRQYSGREIVGAVGVAMLISALSGLYLWWPGRARLRMALGPRRGFNTSRNLHYLCGFYGAVMLAMLSFTGIYLAFPEAGRATTALFSTLSPSTRGLQAPERAARPVSAANTGAAANGGATDAKGARTDRTDNRSMPETMGQDTNPGSRPSAATGADQDAAPAAAARGRDASAAAANQTGDARRGEDGRRTGREPGQRGPGQGEREAGAKALPVDAAVKIAQDLFPGARLVGVGLPAGPRGVYRVGMNRPGTTLNSPGGDLVVFINPADGSVLRQVDPGTGSAGDRYLALMRPLHAASGLGLGWQILYCVAGLLPPLLAVTGTLMWLRKRRMRAAAPLAVRA